MKTDELISALAADKELGSRLQWRLIAGACLGLVVSAVIFFVTLGVRDDLGSALHSWRFDLKIALLLLAVSLSLLSCGRAASPTSVRPGAAIWLIAIAILAAVAIEMVSVPASQWSSRVAGANALVCLTAIPALSIAPLIATLLALQSGACTSPAWAGAFSGLAAAALGAALYGMHCSDDSPLFVATWYPLAAVPVIVAGTIAGRRMLQW